MGLLGGMARTAVVAGTATAVSNPVSRRQARRWNEQEYAHQPEYAQQAEPQAGYAAAPSSAPAGGSSGLTAEIERLNTLRTQGVLTDEEFAAAKAKVLGI